MFAMHIETVTKGKGRKYGREGYCKEMTHPASREKRDPWARLQWIDELNDECNDEKRDDVYNLNHRIDCRAGGVLVRVADGIACNCRLVRE